MKIKSWERTFCGVAEGRKLVISVHLYQRFENCSIAVLSFRHCSILRRDLNHLFNNTTF